jgi:microcystin degradation protein MlrC
VTHCNQCVMSGSRHCAQVEPSLADIAPRIEAALNHPDRTGPVLLVEPSDNIGGGAPGDATTLLRHLLRSPPRRRHGGAGKSLLPRV